MQFQWNGSKVILKGDTGLGRSQVSLKSMMLMIKKKHRGILIELSQVELQPTNSKEQCSTAELPVAITTFLTQYHRVFEMPQGIPPKRG